MAKSKTLVPTNMPNMGLLDLGKPKLATDAGSMMLLGPGFTEPANGSTVIGTTTEKNISARVA